MENNLILHRFMSREEYEKFMAGEVLHNETDHYRDGKGGSLSKGFCFFAGPIREWAHRLNGLVTYDVLLTVQFTGMHLDAALYRSMGMYCDNPSAAYPKPRLYTEACTTAYSRASMRFISADFSYGMNPMFINKRDVEKILQAAKQGKEAL